MLSGMRGFHERDAGKTGPSRQSVRFQVYGDFARFSTSHRTPTQIPPTRILDSQTPTIVRRIMKSSTHGVGPSKKKDDPGKGQRKQKHAERHKGPDAECSLVAASVNDDRNRRGCYRHAKEHKQREADQERHGKDEGAGHGHDGSDNEHREKTELREARDGLGGTSWLALFLNKRASLVPWTSVSSPYRFAAGYGWGKRMPGNRSDVPTRSIAGTVIGKNCAEDATAVANRTTARATCTGRRPS